MGQIKQQYKIVQKTVGNKTGEAYSLNVPRAVMEIFSKETKWTLTVTETSIIYTSGIDLNQLKQEARTVSIKDIQ